MPVQAEEPDTIALYSRRDIRGDVQSQFTRHDLAGEKECAGRGLAVADTAVLDRPALLAVAARR